MCERIMCGTTLEHKLTKILCLLEVQTAVGISDFTFIVTLSFHNLFGLV
jgi:hypothetical protein